MPTPSPIITPMVVANSGIAITLLKQREQHTAHRDAGERGTDREAHREHRAEREDQDDDGESDSEQLRRRRRTLSEHVPAVLEAHASIVGCSCLILSATAFASSRVASSGSPIVA